MKVSDDQLEKLLAAQSPRELKNLLVRRKLVPTLAQASKLHKHIHTLQHPNKSIRLGVIHTYTSELLDPWLHFSATLNQLDLDIYHAPYGVTAQEATANSGLTAHSPDITLILLTPEDLHPALRTAAASIQPAGRADIQFQVQQAMSSLLGRFRDSVPGHIVVTLLPSPLSPGLGLYDGMAVNSETHWWNQIKAGLATDLREKFHGVTYLDLDQLVMQVGRDNFFDLRLWYSSTFPFTPAGALAISDAVTTIAASIRLTKAKVIVLDADNTLWGGVIGEDGIQGIALGQDYPGRVYIDFQKRILSLQQRGFILALCSKNNPEDVNDVLQNHPHQLLRNEHFAAQRVNWLPKPDNLRSLAEELNLGLDSFIFVDDSDYECAAVRHSLGDVEVIQVPSSSAEIPTCLDNVARLEITSLTREDLEKTAMYTQERLRKSQFEELSAVGGSVQDYLQSLNMKMSIGLDDLSNLQRLAQLTQKTNQFNLTTRRYNEQDMAEKINNAKTSVYHFSLADNFGDSGIVGLAIIERESKSSARLDNFLMSCRVIGRMAERAFLNAILYNLKSSGVEELSADYIPTRKNVLVETFLPDNGFCQTADGRYVRNLLDIMQSLGNDFPIHIEGPVSE
jgi:FkbH-like protein